MKASTITDRAALDALYNLRAAVPEHPAFFARWQERSAVVRDQWPLLPDRGYGAGERTAIDVFPAPRPGAPLFAFIHGGYWQALDRKYFSFLALPFLDRGFAVATIGYDLAPAVGVSTITEQIRGAIAWLWRRCEAFGADPGRIVLAGHSAGGHLGAMALATDWQARGLPARPIKAACLVSGVFDLEPIRLCYLNEVLGLDRGEAQMQSPIANPPSAPVPVLLTLGSEETAAFHDQSRAYAATLAAAGVPHEVLIQDGMNHFSVIEALADADNPATAWVIARAQSGPDLAPGATKV